MHAQSKRDKFHESMRYFMRIFLFVTGVLRFPSTQARSKSAKDAELEVAQRLSFVYFFSACLVWDIMIGSFL